MKETPKKTKLALLRSLLEGLAGYTCMCAVPLTSSRRIAERAGRIAARSGRIPARSRFRPIPCGGARPPEKKQ